MTRTSNLGCSDEQLTTLRRSLTAWANECMREAEAARAADNLKAARHWQDEWEEASAMLEMVLYALNL